MKRLLHEPLLQFLLAGALLFAADRALERDRPTAQDIIVTSGQIENMAYLFMRVWQRPPTEVELDGLVQDYVREEVLAREAVALGLDRDDTIVRRRLRQKMEFVASDVAALAEPTDEDLQRWFGEHRDRYLAEPRFTLRQVYFSPERRGDATGDDAVRVLATLNRGLAPRNFAELGDATLLPAVVENASASEIARLFDDAFTEQIGSLQPGAWHGPVTSTYGVHLVAIDARTESREPQFSEVRARVLADWEDARRREANEAFYEQLLAKYRVTVEWPQTAAAGTAGGQP